MGGRTFISSGKIRSLEQEIARRYVVSSLFCYGRGALASRYSCHRSQPVSNLTLWALLLDNECECPFCECHDHEDIESIDMLVLSVRGFFSFLNDE